MFFFSREVGVISYFSFFGGQQLGMDPTDGSWITRYPKLIDQLQDVMKEWQEEREQLMLSAEQTQAYCQSLAFQVIRSVLTVCFPLVLSHPNLML